MKIVYNITLTLTDAEKKLLKDARNFFSNLAKEMEDTNIEFIDGWDTDDMESVCYRIDSIFDRVGK